MRSEGFYVNEKSNDTSWVRTSDLNHCATAVPHHHVDYVFSVTQVVGTHSTLTSVFFAHGGLYLLYYTFVRSKLE